MTTFGRAKRLAPWVLTGVLTLTLLIVLVESGSAQKAQKQSTAFKDVLSTYVGDTVSLGIVKKVTGDYFVIEEENTTMTIPISAIQMIKVTKEEEGGNKVEIKLIAKD